MSYLAVVSEKPFSIEAALASREVIAVRSLMAAAGIEQPTGKISVADLDEKFSKSRLSIEQRLQIKVALFRSGILV